ncbi:MAG: hypothetical protein RR739_09665, partial [Clostridia bacterium]
KREPVCGASGEPARRARRRIHQKLDVHRREELRKLLQLGMALAQTAIMRSSLLSFLPYGHYEFFYK